MLDIKPNTELFLLEKIDSAKASYIYPTKKISVHVFVILKFKCLMNG